MVTLVGFASLLPSQAEVLKRSDVVFMYEADPKTLEAYGATMLAWGGTPTKSSMEETPGVRRFGSVGMVTEFDAYCRRFPQTYEQGICRDVEGKPVRVPWLTDHQYQGIPYWWCCTQQPLFRQFLRERVVETVKAGADGLHIDDHLGTAGGLFLGLCFCERCVAGFRIYLKSLPTDRLKKAGIRNAAEFNFRDEIKQWLTIGSQSKKETGHPLWSEWTTYQCRAAADFMFELRRLAAETAGRPIPVGANAGLLWPRHLGDYQALDLFTAETDHRAGDRRFSDLPLVAYRLAESVGRPYAATASGGDWAFIKEHNLPGLIRGWIALAYASGQNFMAPHHQWCYTPEKGTHWYDGPAEQFAPLYRFVRQNAALLDGYETYADLAVVLPYRSFSKNPEPWFELSNRLAFANLSYRLLLAGDEIVDHPLSGTELLSARTLLVTDLDGLLPADRELVLKTMASRPVFRNLDELVKKVHAAVQVKTREAVRVLPRVQKGSAAIHLLNVGYESSHDVVRPLKSVTLKLDLPTLGLAGASRARWFSPGEETRLLSIQAGQVTIPHLTLWGILQVENR
jgi:hypothetical protein